MTGVPAEPWVPADNCWLHPDIVVAESPIEGRGLFAAADISAATVVSRLGGRLVSGSELPRLFPEAARTASYVDTISVDDDLHLVLPPRRDNGYGNHSCDPKRANG